MEFYLPKVICVKVNAAVSPISLSALITAMLCPRRYILLNVQNDYLLQRFSRVNALILERPDVCLDSNTKIYLSHAISILYYIY